MKVLLCQTPTSTCECTVFPLGLAYIAGSLRKHEVLCLDSNVNNFNGNLKSSIEKFQPDVIGLSLRNIDSVTCSPGQLPRSYYEPFVSLVKLIKQEAPNAKLLVGGAGFSIFPKEIMKRNPEIDFAVVSEGEAAVPKLLDNLNHPEKAKNVIARKGNRLIFSARDNTYPNFDALPPPAREHFDLSIYRKQPYSMGVQTKRGCVFNCLYCPNPKRTGALPKLRKPKRVVDELEELVNVHGIREFYFSDPIFNYPASHAMKVCQEIIRRHLDIKWQADFRPDYMTFKLMKTAVESGCAQFNFSPDGASNEAMRVLCKNMTVDCVVNTAHWANSIEGANMGYCFVYDLPQGNMSHYRGLLHLHAKFLNISRKKLRSFGLTRMRIYPDTPLYDLALEQRKIQPETNLILPVYYSHYGEKMAHAVCGLTAGFSEALRTVIGANYS
ncbi:MAG: cobalamin-dependent protein [Candidatus Bathyarchaeota archaeon]|nr:cobalamin-dependent protein [Candidatus Bathyarchaeota archaeon]